MNWSITVAELPGTLLLFVVCLVGAWLMLLLGQRIERESIERDLRRQVHEGRLVVIPDDQLDAANDIGWMFR